MSDYDIGIKQVQLTGRKTQYQRVGVNQTITNASGSVVIVVDLGGLGTRALNIAYKTNAAAAMHIFTCDVQGNAFTAGSSVANVNSGTGVVNGGLVIADWGGAPKIAIYIVDKSAIAGNVVQFIDVWYTSA
jgi:hypothetical protein